jgi:3-dehydroquinate dehydratase-1
LPNRSIGGPTTIVAVIASAADLDRAMRLRVLPDAFELRLDALHRLADELEHAARRLRAPLIITARHPREGAFDKLAAPRRRELLLRFLPLAAFIDVELRSVAELRSVLDRARELRVSRIISVHDFTATPRDAELERFARSAKEHDADIFKLATRINSGSDAARLLSFFHAQQCALRISIVPIGPGARAWRLTFAREGSALNYTHLGSAHVEGQWRFREFRRALATTH